PPSGVAQPARPSVSPEKDTQALKKQGAERPTAAGEVGAHPSDVYAEDWWSQARPVFEIHGYYRLRAELFHNFALGRKAPWEHPTRALHAKLDPRTPRQLWPQPTDNYYIDTQGNPHGPRLCGDDPLNMGPCENNTQAGANMRFRLNPELHISDNLRVLS